MLMSAFVITVRPIRKGSFMLRAAIALAATLAANGAHAQLPPAPAQYVSNRCLQSIPKESLTRVPVFASLAMRDSLRFEIPASAANMLQTVADRIAAMSGLAPGALPPGEPEIQWDSIGRSLELTWYRDGRLAWRAVPDTGGWAHAPAKAAMLFGRALDSAQARGETFMLWPADVTDDSLEMLIDFRRPHIDSAGTVKPVRVRAGVPVFSIAAPSEKEVRAVKPPLRYYPPTLQSRGVEGRVMMEFTVDTTGHVDPATIHDVWPASRPRLTGAMEDYYQELVRTARRMVLATRFAPAEVGGCKVSQVVREPFTWAIAK